VARRTETANRQAKRRTGRAAQAAKARPARGSIGRVLRDPASAKWVALCLVLIHLAFAALVFEPQPHNGGDNAAYLTLAESLLSGQGYRDLYDPAKPLHTQYPPVFPLILAGALALGLQPWIWFKAIVVMFSAAAVGLSYLWIARRREPMLALCVGLLLAVSPGVLTLSHWELSDVPFWAFTMGALLAWERLGRNDTKRTILAVALTALAYFTRSAGLPLIVAAGAWLILRKRWKQLAIFAAIIGPLAFWWWWRARTQGGVDYVSQFWFVNPYAPEDGRVGAGDLVRRVLNNNEAYFTRHFPMLLVGLTAAPLLLLSISTALLAIYGWARELRHPRVAEFFLPLYIGLLYAWPAVWSGERFMLPALPVILYYAGKGLIRLGKRLPVARTVPAAALVTALIVVISLPAMAVNVRWGMMCMRLYGLGDRYPCHLPQWKDFFAMGEMLPRILPDDAVVLSRKPRLLYGISDKPGANYPMFREPDSLFNVAERTGAKYVILDQVDNISRAYLTPVLLRRPHAFCIVNTFGADRIALLGIKPGASAMRDRDEATARSAAVSFEICGPEYWKNEAVRDSVLKLGR